MTLNLERLASEVARVTTVHASAMALIKKLTGELEAVSAELTAKAAQVPPVIDTYPLDALINQLKASTDSLAGAVSNSSDVTPVKEVVLNADNPTVPTVAVLMPEVLPESVTVHAKVIAETVDTTSKEPQVVVVVKPDAPDPSADVVSDTISTPADQVDVTVAAAVEVHTEIKDESGVDVVEAVKKAFEATPEVVAEPKVE